MAVEEEKGRRSDLRLKYCSRPPPSSPDDVRLLPLSLPPCLPHQHWPRIFRLFFVLSSAASRQQERAGARLINSPFDQTWEESMADDDKAVYVRIGESIKKRLGRGSAEKGKAKDNWTPWVGKVNPPSKLDSTEIRLPQNSLPRGCLIKHSSLCQECFYCVVPASPV